MTKRSVVKGGASMSSRSSLHPLRFATLRLSLQLLDPSAISLRLCKGVGRRSHEVPRGTNLAWHGESVSASLSFHARFHPFLAALRSRHVPRLPRLPLLVKAHAGSTAEERRGSGAWGATLRRVARLHLHTFPRRSHPFPSD